MSLYLRGKIWWSRIQRFNTKIDRSTKKRNKTDAMRVEARWLTELADQGDNVKSLFESQRRVRDTLKFFEKRFFAYLENNVTAPRTREFYKGAYKPLVESSLGSLFLDQITTKRIEEWVQERRTQVGPVRVNSSLRTLRRALRLAEEWGDIKKAPKIKLLPGENQREFVISEEQLEKMLAHEKCTSTLKVMVPFLIDTGLRISEAIELTWDKVGLEPKPGAQLGWVFISKGKSKYAKRYVPLTERAHSILKKLKEKAKSSPYVFVNKDGEKLSRHWVSEQFRTLRNEMKLPDDCVVHSTRHTFCTRLGEAGCGAFEIQKLAGHSSITISQKYVHPTPERLESAISSLNELNTKKKAVGKS